MNEDAAGHAFISYVREDRQAVMSIASALRAADVPVWTDKDKLTPGQDWQVTIRKAIQRSALAFIAVFSTNSQARGQSYQNEELALAVQQFRKHPPGRVWLIPVRLDECDLPDFDLGAGRTLDSLQRVDLFGEDADDEKIRLVSAVLRILSDQAPDSATVRALVSQGDSASRGPTLAAAVKSMVLEPRRKIELDDLVVGEAKRVRDELRDPDVFPNPVPLESDTDTARRMVERFNRYHTAVQPLAHALVAGCAWGESGSLSVWTRALRAVASVVDGPKSGNSYLLAMESYPLTVLVYAGSLAAVANENYSTLRAITVETIVHVNDERVPVVNTIQPSNYEQPFELAANLLAATTGGEEVPEDVLEGWRTRGGMRYTPISDHLHLSLQPMLSFLVSDDRDFDDLFDRTEILLPVIATDNHLQAAANGRYMDRGWFGRFTWRYRHSANPLHRQIQRECVEAGDSWAPLSAGLFGGSSVRAVAAFESFGEVADHVMRERW